MSKFHQDKEANTPAEHLFVELLRHAGIPAFINLTPDPDSAPDEETRQAWYQGRQAYDVGIGFPELPFGYVDVKCDWEAQHSGNIFVEGKSLLHTSSETFAYFVIRPDGIFINCLPVLSLKQAFVAEENVNRGDGTFMTRKKYRHVTGGDQADNLGILLPSQDALRLGKPFGEWVKSIKQPAA